MSGYSKLVSMFGTTEDHFLTNKWKKIYMMYDIVHQLKNIRNNLQRSQRFIFPKFEFHQLIDHIIVPAGEMQWNLLHRVYEEDEKLLKLRKAQKLTYRTLHPGNNKQSVQLALKIFHETTFTAVKSYFPEELPAAEFLKVINMWWIISNSKSKYSNNLLGHAAVAGDTLHSGLRNGSVCNSAIVDNLLFLSKS